MSVGYQDTEIGLIPNDWHVSPLKEVAKFRTGPFGTLLKAEEYYSTDGVPLVSVQDIGDGVLNFGTHTPLVPRSVTRRLPEYVLRAGDIVFGRKGNIERSALVSKAQDGCFLGSDAIRGRLNEACYPPFVVYQLQMKRVQAKLLQQSIGTTMPSLNQSILNGLLIAVPPLPEQRAIAEALSDVDALIDSLDKLIAKKRDIKQGAMQELLSGRKRLPGFHGKWESRMLGQVSHIKTGGRNNEDKVEDGEYPFFVRSATVERINSYSYECEGILVPGEGGIGSIFHYANGRFDVHQRVYAITQFDQSVFAKYVYYFMVQNFGADAMRNTVKATVDSLRLPTFQKFEVTLPFQKEEQIAIAGVLSDMDAEIVGLERRREKTIALKQGMMQELLTGRTRLV